jgi:DNA recombination protein RmuC
MSTKLREVEALPGEQTEGLLGEAYSVLQEPDV